MPRLRPVLALTALAVLAPGAAHAQNVCSPSTAPQIRYAGYPGSTPYSNASTRITSNCSGPSVDSGATADPYYGLAFPVPGYQPDGLGPGSSSASMGAGPVGGQPPVGYAYPASMAGVPLGYGASTYAPYGAGAYGASYGAPYGPYGAMAPYVGASGYAGAPGYGGYSALGALAPAGYPGLGPAAAPYGAAYGYGAPGYYPSYAPQAGYAGYGAPAVPYGYQTLGTYAQGPAGYPPGYPAYPQPSAGSQ